MTRKKYPNHQPSALSCRLFNLITLFVMLAGNVSAQQAAPAGTAPGEVLDLPVFEVSTEKDEEYSSSQSIGATRVGLALLELETGGAGKGPSIESITLTRQ